MPISRDCAGMQSELGYTDVSWGRQLASPTAAGWRQIKPGISICSNAGSNDWFLFQCTELVNLTDLSGWSQRIVRGWIHFTANSGTLPSPSQMH